MLTKILKSIAVDKAGTTAVEYGLIVSLIVIAMLSALQAVASETVEMWQHIETETSGAMSN